MIDMHFPWQTTKIKRFKMWCFKMLKYGKKEEGKKVSSLKNNIWENKCTIENAAP